MNQSSNFLAIHLIVGNKLNNSLIVAALVEFLDTHLLNGGDEGGSESVTFPSFLCTHQAEHFLPQMKKVWKHLICQFCLNISTTNWGSEEHLNMWLTWVLRRQHMWRWGCPRISSGSCGDEWRPGRTLQPSWWSRSTRPPYRTRLVNRCSRHCGSPSQSQHSPWPADRGGQHPEVSRGPSCWGMDHPVYP